MIAALAPARAGIDTEEIGKGFIFKGNQSALWVRQLEGAPQKSSIVIPLTNEKTNKIYPPFRFEVGNGNSTYKRVDGGVEYLDEQRRAEIFRWMGGDDGAGDFF